MPFGHAVRRCEPVREPLGFAEQLLVERVPPVAGRGGLGLPVVGDPDSERCRRSRPVVGRGGRPVGRLDGHVRAVAGQR